MFLQSRKASNMFTAQRASSAPVDSTSTSFATIMADVPAAQATNFILSSDSHINNDRITNVALQTVAGQLSSPLQTGERVQVKVGADWLDAISGAGLASWTLPDVILEEGTHQAQVRVLNALGDSGPVASFDYTLDTVAPPAPSALVLADDTGESSTDRITADNTPTFTGPGDSRYDVILYDGAGNELGRSATTGGLWSITPAYPFANGVHTVSARAIDAAGNLSGLTGPTTFAVDTTAPTLAIRADRTSLKIGDTAVITFTFSERPGASFDAADIAVSGGTLGPLTAADSTGLVYSATFTPAGGVDASTATISVGAGAYADVAGNAGASALLSGGLAYDTLAPAAPMALDLEAASDTGDSNSDNVTGDTTPTFSGTAEAGSTVRLYAGGQQVGTGVATNGAWAITSGALAAGTHQITAIAIDAAGNAGPASGALAIQIVSAVPTTQVASIAISDDTGTSRVDFITRTQAQVISGTLDAPLAAGEVIKVSVDGGRNWLSAHSDSPLTWSVAAALVEGQQTILAQVENATGAAGTAAVQDVTLDLVGPGVTVASNSSSLKSGETAGITLTFTEAPGATFTVADISVSGGRIGALSGSGLVYTATFTPTAGVDQGSATISVGAGSFADLAGNINPRGDQWAIAFDTLAPAAPPAPTLAAASDTGMVGDGVTTSTSQVIEGSGAEAGALVHLYDGNGLLGSERADANGHWRFTASLGSGAHSLRATQLDAAGNESVASNPFALTVERAHTPTPNPEPDPEPNPPTLIDGVQVVVAPVTLPGGVRGTSITVPIVTAERQDTNGAALVADIALAASGGATVLLGQLPVGYGLSSSGAIVDRAGGPGLLAASIRAAMAAHAPGEQGQLVDSGLSFLDASVDGSLLVHTLRPASVAGAGGTLTLTGAASAAGPGTALVIATGGLAGGSKLALVDVDFSAVIGAAEVSIRGDGATVAGDGASQHFTLGSGSGSALLAGGGNDLLGLGPDAGAGATLHGGAGDDRATFAGQRADFDVVFHNGYAVVNSKAMPDAKALVVNVEQLQFSDGAVAVENDAGLATLAGLYQSVLGRQADLGGFEFWADHLDAGASWGAIALALLASSERLGAHADVDGDPDDIGLLYQALFARDADAAGLAHWRAAMEGGMTLEQVATGFVESAEMVGHQRAAHDWDFSF